jgi:hypothetical protein
VADMYQSYPTSGQQPMPQQPDAPRSILTAVRLMYVGAALNALGLILTIAFIHSVRTAIRRDFPHYTTTQIHRAEVGYVVVLAILAILEVGLWLWMAWGNRTGKSWARIISSVLFGLSTLLFVTSFAQARGAVSLLFTGLTWLVGLVAIVMLWQRDSSAYYQAAGSSENR